MKNKVSIKDVYKYLPEKFRYPLTKSSFCDTDIQEVRLRINRPFCITINNVERYLLSDGTVSENTSYGIPCTKQDLLQCFDSICNHSVHSYAKELSQGYITLEGGNRVGLCGTYIFKGTELHTVKDISSINIRIAHQVRGSANQIFNMVDFSTPKGLLIVGKPLSAKTTILRDLCRLISSKFKVSIIDERCEIGGVYNGIPQNDIGLKADIFNGYPKDIGINCAVRTMSPDIIVCDEIGSLQDFKAIKMGTVCGVKFICTAHADSVQQVLNNPNFNEILNTNALDYIVLLGNGTDIGKVLEFKLISN